MLLFPNSLTEFFFGIGFGENYSSPILNKGEMAMAMEINNR